MERALASCVGDACLIPFARPPSDVPTTSKKVLYLLQHWSVKWEAFIDVKCADEVQNGDRLTAVTAFSGNTTSTAMKVSPFSTACTCMIHAMCSMWRSSCGNAQLRLLLTVSMCALLCIGR